MNLRIVIAVFQHREQNGITTLLYDDTTEKFIMDPDELLEGEVPPSTIYANYLSSKLASRPGWEVVNSPIEVLSNIDVQKLLADDAKSKITTEELNALIEEINSLKNDNK